MENGMEWIKMGSLYNFGHCEMGWDGVVVQEKGVQRREGEIEAEVIVKCVNVSSPSFFPFAISPDSYSYTSLISYTYLTNSIDQSLTLPTLYL